MNPHPMFPCNRCRSLVRTADPTCPTCGEVLDEGGASIRPASVFALMGLALSGCDWGTTALYGVAITDDDKDGWVIPEDCDDADEDVYPGAEETPGDGIDSNCDGEDDT